MKHVRIWQEQPQLLPFVTCGRRHCRRPGGKWAHLQYHRNASRTGQALAGGIAHLQAINYANSNNVPTLQLQMCLNVLSASIALGQYYTRSSSFALAK